MELSSIEGAQIVRALDLATYQLQELAKEVGSHDQQFEELGRQLADVKISLALMQASKTRSDLSIAALPDFFQRVDNLYEGHKRMQSNMDSIRNQAWAAFLSAIAIMIASWIWQAQSKPAKADPSEAEIYRLARHVNLIVYPKHRL
jgi:hypothetical protein